MVNECYRVVKRHIRMESRFGKGTFYANQNARVRNNVFGCIWIGELNLKVVILAGGYGTRISEESQFKPKPMIEIGEKVSIVDAIKELINYKNL